MAETSGAGIALIFAFVNAWLAAYRHRPPLRWFAGSLLLLPFAPILTLYLAMGSHEREVGAVSERTWSWLKAAALVFLAAVLVVGALQLAVGQPAGGSSTSLAAP